MSGSSQKEFFVHNTGVLGDFCVFEKDDSVSFTPSFHKSKECAINVQKICMNTDGKTQSELCIKSTKKNCSRRKNTIDFKPNHELTDMRVLYQHGGNNIRHCLTTRDILIVTGMFEQNHHLQVYHELLNELDNCGIQREHLFKNWHKDSHLIANDKCHWKQKCPTFHEIVQRIQKFFNMTVNATRLNFYKNSDDWKPYHHDAAAIDSEKATYQNFTVGVSFGLERDVSFQHAKHGTTVSIPLSDASVYAFSRDVNMHWRHGILQLPPHRQNEQGRISIIAWGWCEQV